MTEKIAESAQFRIREGTARPDGNKVLLLSGPVDQDAAPILAAELERRLALGERRLYLDMGSVSFLSSAGVGSLISSITAFRDKGEDLVLQNASDGVLHVFELLCLQKFVTIEDG